MDSSILEINNSAELEQAVESITDAVPALRKPLVEAAEAAMNGKPLHSVTVRKLLSWFGSQRRGSFIVWYIRHSLDKLGVTTDPDFNSVWIDAEVKIVPKKTEPLDAMTTGQPEAEPTETSPADVAADSKQMPTDFVVVGGAIEDSTYRIGKLDAANKPVLSVALNHSIEHAVTQMLVNGFSQLPVMQGERDVKGILTWESIGVHFALGKTGQEVRTS
jgi:CBS domain-containing protein